MSVGRQTQLQVVHYLRATIAFNQSTPQLVGYLPANCRVLRASLSIETAFNAGTTNTISVGYSSGGTNLFNATAAGSITLDSATISESNINPNASGDTSVYVQYNETGTAPTAGFAVVMVEYIPDSAYENQL